MLSNQILQRTVYEIGDIMECNCSVWNMEGVLLASFGGEKAAMRQVVREFLEEIQEKGGGTVPRLDDKTALFTVCEGIEPIYIFLLEHEGKVDPAVSGRLCVSQFEGLLKIGREQMDKNRFMQNLILDNLLLVDIYNQAKKLSIPVEKRRVVVLAEPKNPEDTIVLDTVKGLYTSGTGDYVTAVDEGRVILIKALEDTESYKEINRMAEMIVDTVNTEAMVNVRVAYGTVAGELKDVSQS